MNLTNQSHPIYKTLWQKYKTHTCTQTQRQGQEPCTSAKEPLISAKEPLISTNEPCVSVNEPFTSAKEPYMFIYIYIFIYITQTQGPEPFSSAKEPYISAYIHVYIYIHFIYIYHKHRDQSPIDLQKSPIYLQKSPLYLQKSPIYLHIYIYVFPCNTGTGADTTIQMCLRRGSSGGLGNGCVCEGERVCVRESACACV